MSNTARIFYLVPVSRDAGLTSMALGLVRALQLAGVRVGFAKPVAQAEADAAEPDLSGYFARTLCSTQTLEPIAYTRAIERVRAGDLAGLMEDVVSNVDAAGEGNQIVVVEGLIPDVDFQIATRLNIEIVRALGAELIPVVSARARGIDDLDAIAAGAAEQYGDGGRRPLAGVLVNHADVQPETSAENKLSETLADGTPVLATVPTAEHLLSPRLIDVVSNLGLRVLRTGATAPARVQNVLVAASSPEKLLPHLRPGTLVVLPSDRADAMLAVALAALRGMPIAGMLLTGGGALPAELAGLFRGRPLDHLPILGTDEDTFHVASRLANLSSHIGRGDAERMEQVIDFIGERIMTAPLVARLDVPVMPLMSPPIFRTRLVESARAANRRIVLPEGDEPRTIQAAALCAARGIARCVLLGSPETIRAVAAGHGIELPANVEIVDPEVVREHYVAPMVELRRAKGLTELQAHQQLEDTVVLGTMMLATGEVDGLVSGAVHTTANTVRPALQLIRTLPDSPLVSSVFFMLMPDQVFVYGDCAINPDPNAEELAQIAIQSADSARAFGIDPRVAMISYSTGTSGAGADVEKVKEATAIARRLRPDLVIDGPIQYDAAAVEDVARQKAPGSPLGGHANVFVFPDLNTGNTTYKAVQRSANVVSVGPMLQGLRKPVNDLSRGALVDDIVYTIALTAIQAATRKTVQKERAAAAPAARSVHSARSVPRAEFGEAPREAA
ncbi:phosphate acetyltransferase [Paraburkholderia dinghuensis]|uniref:Phosphate acetyltransferase n=1 Tax=Paraburkholderia dinghuensis TaxID=2305225 RepID=A0A3N6MS18_9BURK|nr:phosphate acetyltransferase [Paraburkholderia dinghuensis]RQH00591.1 phosphate acetyltransferase [Paraburkholderia dinghuensis]